MSDAEFIGWVRGCGEYCYSHPDLPEGMTVALINVGGSEKPYRLWQIRLRYQSKLVRSVRNYRDLRTAKKYGAMAGFSGLWLQRLDFAKEGEDE